MLTGNPPCGSEVLFFFIAGKYSGLIKIWNNRSNGLHLINASKPRAFRHNALNVLGKAARFSRVAGTYNS